MPTLQPETVREQGVGGLVRRPPEAEAAASGVSTLLDLQRRAGNRSVQTLLAVQASLQVGATTDPAELEADAVANRVVAFFRGGRGDAGDPGVEEVRQLARSVRRRPLPGTGPEGGTLEPGLEHELNAARGGGRPFEGPARADMEQAFGADFSDVRLHVGPQATALNRALGAQAFTYGRDIFFEGRAPDTTAADGQRLLAHELAHTVQQGG